MGALLVARVLVFSDLWLPFPGGAERLVFNVARHLALWGHDVGALTGYEAAQQFDGPPVAHAPLGVGPDHAAGAALLARFVDGFRPQVVLTHHFYAREFAGELAATGLPVVQLVLNGQRLPFARLAVFISEYVRRQTDSRPTDLTITPPAFPDVVADTHGDAIGFIKPIQHKGVELVYRLARRLPRRRFVVLRGEWQDLELIEHLPNVRFVGPLNDVREFYAMCRLVLMPSLSEDAGTVAQEATLNGLPCLSSAAGGLAETNGGGVLLPVRGPFVLQEWAAAIRELDDPATYARVVDRQQAHLAAADHHSKLDALAERVAALAG